MSCQAYGSAVWNRGIFGPFLGPRRYVSGRFGVSGERGPRGRVGSGAEADGSGDRCGIRPVRIDRRPWPLLAPKVTGIDSSMGLPFRATTLHWVGCTMPIRLATPPIRLCHDHSCCVSFISHDAQFARSRRKWRRSDRRGMVHSTMHACPRVAIKPPPPLSCHHHTSRKPSDGSSDGLTIMSLASLITSTRRTLEAQGGNRARIRVV